jgi:hypothetical protein
MFMADCLSGCASQYECKPLNVPGPAGQQAESFAPWVKVWMGDGENEITVGNESFPSAGNTACIKSFEVGWIDNPEVTLEILDEMGGRMQAFIDALRKNSKLDVEGTRMRFQFGWTLTTCEGSKSSIPSMPFISQVHEIQVNYSEGKIKYNIKGGSADKILNVIREDATVGEDDKPIKLEDAIQQLASKCPPIVVKYCKRDSDGKIKCEDGFDWVKFGKGGPKATWHADNQNRIAVITKWVENFRVNNGTPEGVGIIPIWDPKEPDVLTLLLDPTEQPSACGNSSSSLGTFIVNGGKCSPVIEFTPTFNWVAGMANFNAGGDTSSPGTTKSNFHEKSKRPKQEKEHCETTGLQQQNTITQQAWRSYGPKNAWRDAQRSIQAHAKAGRITEVGVTPIEATLKILGDPRDKFTSMIQGTSVGIVAINPFHLGGDKNKGCGDWLADPPCNAILSNKNWTVLGVNHSIKEGTYTTTLKLSLGAPVINIDAGEPLGGSGSGGATVKNTG